jgi:hypothetical protein
MWSFLSTSPRLLNVRWPAPLGQQSVCCARLMRDNHMLLGVCLNSNSAPALESLQVHSRGMPLAEDVDLRQLAAQTEYYTGA